MLFVKRIFNTTLIGVLTLTIGVNQSANAVINIPDAPIFIGNNIQPNIMFAVDDSGSMDWEVLQAAGAGVHGGPNSGNLDISPNDFNEDREMCAGYNVLAYDPSITYTPWIGEDNVGTTFANASITAARIDPFQSGGGTRNLLNADGTAIAMFYGVWTDNVVVNGSYDAGECPTATASGGGYTSRTFTDPRIIFVNTLGTAPDPQYTNPNTGLSHSAQTNFANWYQYYRKREYVLKRVMSDLINTSTARLGLATLWNRNNVGTPIRDMTNNTDKEALEDQVFNINSNNGTPLRALLDNVGRYFDDTDGSGAPAAIGFTEGSPILPSNLGGECQQNFTILMSDGFWNGSYSGGVGNADGDANTTITVDINGTPKIVQVDTTPHSDTFSNTLADIAMHYYERDLSALADRVPVIPVTDENNRQHMVTYAVAFGLTGTGLTTPADHEPTTAAPPPTGWTQPVSNANTTLDDMQHAAFNGRGIFLNASNPQALITSLTNAISDIDARNSFSGTSVAVNSTILRTDGLLFTAGFDSDDYSGSLEALSIDVNGNIAATPLWNAATVAGLDRTTTGGTTTGAITARTNIFTIVNKAGTQTPIAFNTTDADLVAATAPPIVPPATTPAFPGTDVINYIAGDWSREQNNAANAPNNTFRNREDTLLGDIVSSTPVVAGPDDFSYDLLPGTEGSSYTSHLNTKRSRFTTSGEANSLVLVGANDGMLHAFRALNSDGSGSGSEVFAYVPKTVHSNLHLLTDPSYGHKFYANSTGFVGDAYISGWQTLFVSALGEGGRGIFALDVTNPFSTTNPALWERNSSDTAIDPDYAELGFIKHRPVVVRLNNGKWGVIVGNGYNSTSNKAQIFILDAADGSIIKKFDTNTGGTGINSTGLDNGMAEPFVLDADGDRIVDFIYAGDLLGNMWKIDISSASDAAWDFSFGSATIPEPFYTAVETGGAPQPITSRPTLAVHPDGGFMILFGTGKFIEPNDNFLSTPPARNSFYGLRDSGTGRPAAARSNKQEQTIDNIVSNGQNVGRIISNNPVDYSTLDGWYMDFAVEDGERFISNPVVRFGNVVFASYIPSNTPCDFSGTSFIMGLDAINGGQTQASIFDFNNDGTVDANDLLNGDIGSGIKVSGTVGGLGVVLTQGGQDKVLTSKLDGGGLEGTMTAGGDLVLGRTSWRQIQ